MSGSVCDPVTGSFTIDIDNPYFPLPVGRQIELRGNGLLVRMTVLDEIETVAGVDTRVVEEYEAADGRVIEISRNYFAQAQDGTVCYFGEEVDIYDENGEVTARRAWGPGRTSPASSCRAPRRPGRRSTRRSHRGRGGPGEGRGDREVTEVPGAFEDTVTMLDRNPLDGSEDTKVYARDVGLIVDEAVRMTRFVSAD
jgi:hypothetical protein